MLPWIGAMLLSPAEAASAVMLSAGSLGLGVDIMLPVGSVPVVLSISDSPIQWVIVPTTVPDRDYNLFVAPAAHRVGAELSWCHPKLRSWCAARLGLAWKSPDVALRTRGDILVGSADRVYHDSFTCVYKVEGGFGAIAHTYNKCKLSVTGITHI